MELEDILKMRFPHRDMQPSSGLSEEVINEERKMADLVTELVKKGLDINILVHDSAFKKLYNTIKSVEQDKYAIQREEERIKIGSIGLTDKEESEFAQRHENDPFGLEFEYGTSEITGYDRNGEYNLTRTRDYNQKCSYTIGEKGELIAISSLTEQTGTKNEKDPNKIGKRIITSTKKISVENEQALYSESSHEENYVVGTGVKRINDSEKSWRMNEFDTTISYTESWKGWVLDLNGKTLEEHKPSRETMIRNQDGVTATQYLNDGTKRIILCPYNELYMQPADTIINPSEEEINKAQSELLNKLEKYGIKDYKNYEMTTYIDGKAEKDRFGIAYAGSEIKLLKTMDKTRELNEKGVEPLKTEYIPDDKQAQENTQTQNIPQPQPVKVEQQEPLRTDYIPDDKQAQENTQTQNIPQPQPAKVEPQEPLRTDYIPDDKQAQEGTQTQNIPQPQPAKVEPQEPLKTDYIPDANPAQTDSRQKKIGDIKAMLSEIVADGISIEELQEQLNSLSNRDASIERSDSTGDIEQ